VHNSVPKYLGYFERVLEGNSQSDGQLVAGLRYAFPHAMAQFQSRFPRVIGLHDRMAARPRVEAYLKSARRIPFNEHGTFRHYPELDVAS
jgi:glutathione S-transferase